jgi:hypothetical protein
MNIEKKKKEVELMKVQAAKAEFELKIIQRMEEIERLEDNIKLQEEKISELQHELKGE